MKLSLPKKYNKKIVKAIAEFDLISDNEDILVGVSGGKDSTFLLYSLSVLSKHLSLNFNITAVSVDLGFKNKKNIKLLQEYCDILGIPFYIKKTNIIEYLKKEKEGGNNPCAKCAYFRKGALTEFMNNKGFKKIAYGHHYDDAVITYLMSIIYSGQLKTFQPQQFLSKNEIYIIRPLVYLREKEIVEGKKIMQYNPPPSPCPFVEESKRKEIKNNFYEYLNDKQIFYNMAAAMREGAVTELWPEPLTWKEIGQKMDNLWGK